MASRIGRLCTFPIGDLGGSREAHVPAESASAEEDAWIPGADGDEGRAEGPEAAPREGAAAADGVGVERDERLARTERLRGDREFQRLFRGGARIEREGFVLLWAGGGGPRAAGFAAGRRLGGSVVRNRARRRLREAYRREKGLAPTTGVRLCFVARPGALRASFGELTRQVDQALRQMARRLGS